MAYIEPCCCERQLPRLLREGRVFFQTSGDVTVSHLMKSVGCMVDNGSDMWLMIPSVNVKLLRVIAHWFAREWIVRLHLLTQDDCSEMVKTELCGSMPAVEYACDSMVRGGVLAFVGKHDLVALQGPMLLVKDFSLQMYAGVYGSRAMLDVADGKVRSMMEPFIAMMNVKKRRGSVL